MSTPNGSIKLSNKDDVFVDVSYLATSSSDPAQPISSTIQSLKMLGQAWERSLFSTGGAINFAKSFRILMGWQWRGGTAKLLPPKQHELNRRLQHIKPCSSSSAVSLFLLSHPRGLPLPLRG